MMPVLKKVRVAGEASISLVPSYVSSPEFEAAVCRRLPAAYTYVTRMVLQAAAAELSARIKVIGREAEL